MARMQLVVFTVGNEEFAVDIRLTREVVLMCEITPVPETRHYVEGVMNLRGNLVPVLDFSKRLRAFRPVKNGERRIIITNLDGRLAGLIVDGASEVIRVTDDMIEPIPDLVAEIGVDYIQGVVNLNGRFITLIDVERALAGEAVAEFERVIEALSQTRDYVRPAQAV